MRSTLIAAAGLAALAFAAPAAGQQTWQDRQAWQERQSKEATFIDQEMAALHALDKIAARVSKMWVPVGAVAEFGRLSIDVKACRKRPPEEPPEAAAFLEIVDSGRDGQAVDVFRGWMFASSPSLSAMEHPLYDIWVAGCMSADEAATAEALDKTGGVEDMGDGDGAGAPSAGPPVPSAPASKR